MEVGEDRILRLLGSGELEIQGLLPMASNVTLLATVSDGELDAYAVYKPRRGESPLWDFPDGTLCQREQAAWVVDRDLGWGLVPPTVLRDGPAGLGAVQLFVDAAQDTDVRDVLRTAPDDLRRMAAFDVVINNADRKAGHCLVDTSGRLWGVDHGVAFHAEPKLRTVIWAFADDPLPRSLLADLESFLEAGAARDELTGLLSPDEIDAVAGRARGLLSSGRFPVPRPGRAVPWPPW